MNTLARLAPMLGKGASATLALGLLAVFVAAALYVRNTNANKANGPL